MNPRWFMRMSQLLRRPMSERRAKFLLAITLLCLTLAFVQWLGLWPDALTLPTRGHRMP